MQLYFHVRKSVLDLSYPNQGFGDQNLFLDWNNLSILKILDYTEPKNISDRLGPSMDTWPKIRVWQNGLDDVINVTSLFCKTFLCESRSHLCYGIRGNNHFPDVPKAKLEHSFHIMFQWMFPMFPDPITFLLWHWFIFWMRISGNYDGEKALIFVTMNNFWLRLIKYLGLPEIMLKIHQIF